MEGKKLFLLDAMALIYRAYFALARSPRINSKGKNTNAQFGFTNTLVELLKKEKPTHMAVVFDTKSATVRHDDYTDYKANRQEAPEDLTNAIPDIKQIIKGFNIPCIELDGYEADDLIGTLAKMAEKKGFTTYMVTPDKDYGQLVSEHIFMYKPAAFGQGPQVLGTKEICEKWNLKNVNQVIDLLGLMGDASDNIPGIKGVGEKTAAKLLDQYHTLEGVLEHANEIKGALGEKIRADVDNAILSKKLATIIINAPITFNEEALLIQEYNKPILEEVFETLEFKTLGARILGNTKPENNLFTAQEAPTPNIANNFDAQQMLFDLLPKQMATIEQSNHDYQLIDESNRDGFIEQLKAETVICFDTESTNIDANLAEIVGMSFSWKKNQAFYIPIPVDKNDAIQFLNCFSDIWNNPNTLWVGQNIKYDLLLLKWYGIEIKGKLFDTMLAHYVIEPEGKRNMDALSMKYLQYEPISIETLIGKKGKDQKTMREVPIALVKDYAAEDADVTLQLKSVFEPMLEEAGVKRVFNEIENPLVHVLKDMEFEGIQIDHAFLEQYASELEQDIKITEDKVFELAGKTFNLASPKQLGEVLFEELKLDEKAKKTKTGQYATGEEILEKLRNKHEIVDYIMTFRELSKLKSTYVDALPTMTNPKTNRIHTSYNQAVAVTGRLSSINPNLQNIPIKTEKGRAIRKAFIPKDHNHVLLSADYSQIELRIFAALSGDENMIEAFKQRKDIHTSTAAKVYNISEEEVTSTMRRNAKAVNFGIIYGQQAFGLAENLGISRTEAKTIIDNYYEQYQGVKRYMSQMKQDALELGYASTIHGRKRWLPDLKSGNAVVRGFAERNAINMPIQGTAADMIKLAMIEIHQQIKSQNLKSKMLLQVHDELVFEAPLDEVEQLKSIVINGMQNAMQLPNGVPVIVACGIGNNWLEAH
jgi:DNA polymerase-1